MSTASREPAILEWLARLMPAAEAGQTLRQLLALGVLSLEAAEEPAPALELAPEWLPRFDPAYFDFRIRHYRLLDTCFQIRYGDRELEHWIHPVLAHLQTAASAQPHHTLTAARILQFVYLYREGELLHLGRFPLHITPVSLAPCFMELAPKALAAMLECAARRFDPVLCLNASAVLCSGRLLLLAGEGQGLLAARLLAEGCGYFTDGWVLLERGSGQVRPLPVSLGLRADEARLLERHFPGLAESPQYCRQDGVPVHYLPPPPASLPASGQAARPALLVFVRPAEEGLPAMRPVAKAEAFSRWLGRCGFTRPMREADVALLVQMLEHLECQELAWGDLDPAAETLLAWSAAPCL